MFTRCVAFFLFSLEVCSPVRSAASAQQRDSSTVRATTAAVFRGRIVHRADGSPVRGADVWLVSVDKHGLTDTTGSFRFEGLPTGIQLVEVRSVGLAAERDTIVLAADHDNVRTYALTDQAATLDTVRTVAGAQKYLSPHLRGFEERRNSKQGGQFISDSALRRSENSSLVDVITSHMAGVMMQPITIAGKGVLLTLVSSRKPCQGLALMHSCANVADCFVAIYLDGVLQYSTKIGADPVDLSRAYEVSNLAGVEFYAGGAAAPIAMHSDDDGCGSLWLWTRER